MLEAKKRSRHHFIKTAPSTQCNTALLAEPGGRRVELPSHKQFAVETGRDQPDGCASPCASGPTRAMFACELTGHDQKHPPGSPLVPG